MQRNQRPQRNVNRHHVFYEGRLYRRNYLTNRLRSLGGLVIPMNLYDHRDLHANIRACTPIPPRDEIEGFLDVVVTPELGAPRTHTLDQAIAWFAFVGSDLTVEHLLHQREYITRTDIAYGQAA